MNGIATVAKNDLVRHACDADGGTIGATHTHAQLADDPMKAAADRISIGIGDAFSGETITGPNKD